MHLRTRGVALLSVTAVLASGSLTPVSAASAAMDRQTTSSQLLGLPIIGDLLVPLTGGDLTSVVGALSTTELQNALGTLLPPELAFVVGGLTPAQITGLLGAGGTGSVITGLLGQATGLAGGTPAASQVDALIA